ncbi:MAG: YdgA family protein [Verrucomicrobia subdivision 3 bacterium]|nr:YdgA family protein [Limisphaerales bacterium]
MKKILVVIGLIAVLVAGGYGYNVWKSWTVNASTRQLNEDIENLFAGLQKYKEHVGSYPVGSNADVVKALKGANPKNVIVLVGRKTELNEKGEYIDPWKTPLRIYFSDSGVLVRSAGQNRRFDDSTALESDDYIRSN